ncbi:hypothetical protein [Flavivirga jejuensis]|uniref:Carboxypeptidase regulatory-like domain-containing protein n=1 Tax=Flavivirga jejuensis TaxID=870487 RepID=A0ABT8WNL1_9FLAO|nr:hypothetical protein [Flavivirga jejuensis]MDO5974762.1 hypothetical protein [Flavivirga jejuensis]
MKKVFKIGCGGLLILFIIAMVLGQIDENQKGPRQSFEVINTGTKNLLVTFELINKDGTPSKIYYIKEVVKPNEFVIKRIPEGKYEIITWNEDQSKLIKSTDFEFKLKKPEESDYSLYRFDAAMDKNFAVLFLNVLYEGNSFSEHMSKSVGNDANTIQAMAFYDGSKPFFVADKYTDRNFLDYNDNSLPDEISYGDRVYGLFPFENTLSKKDILNVMAERVYNRFKTDLE